MSERIGLGNSGETYLVSSDYALLTASSFEGFPVGNTRVETEATRFVLESGGNYVGLYDGYQGIGVIGVSTPINQLQAVLVVERSQDEAFAPAYQALASSIILALVSVVVIILSGLWFANRRILKPLSLLQDASNQVMSGNLNTAVFIAGNDEFSLLSRTFNAMTAQLRESIDTLEERVASRTKELAEAQKRAEDASQAKSIFLSNMSHELRTPLNMVIGYSSSMLHMPQMYKNQQLPEVFRDDVQLIQENGQYLLGLINDILDLSKIEAEKFELQPSAIELSDVLSGVIATSIGLLRDKPLQIRPDFPDDLPKVWADPLRVRQIILNLMSNAIKFTETGSVTLSAQVHDGRVRLSVTDTGIGIPENALTAIFDRFQQVQKNASVQGTGLGLDISQRLAHMHGSSITVTSTTGKGSTFTFTLPLATVAEIAQSTSHTVGKEKSVKVFDAADWQIVTKRTILVVENDAETRTRLRRTLEAADYVLLDASDGAQAIDIATALLPDLIILDLDLPDMTGWQVLEQLQADVDAASLPIIALSTTPDAQYPQHAMGFERYLHKTVEPSVLLENVEQILVTREKLGE
jgi:signal transduction histidine kinase